MQVKMVDEEKEENEFHSALQQKHLQNLDFVEMWSAGGSTLLSNCTTIKIIGFIE